MTHHSTDVLTSDNLSVQSKKQRKVWRNLKDLITINVTEMLSIAKASVHTMAPFGAFLECTILEMKLWELELFSLNRRPYLCSHLPNWKSGGTDFSVTQL